MPMASVFCAIRPKICATLCAFGYQSQQDQKLVGGTKPQLLVENDSQTLYSNANNSQSPAHAGE
jgi:hypothetical protein